MSNGSAPCIVLAGGLGTRLRAAVADRPKCLAPVGNHPFLWHLLSALKRHGVGDFVLALGHGSEQVLEAVRTSDAFRGIRSVVEPTALGTGGAILHAMDALDLREALVVNGDTYLDAPLDSMLEPLDLAKDEAVRLAIVQVEDRARFGGVETSVDGRVVRFIGKGRSGAGAINAGLYRIHRQALQGRPQPSFSLEQDVLPPLAAEGRLYGAVLDGTFVDIGVPEDYYAFCRRHA